MRGLELLGQNYAAGATEAEETGSFEQSPLLKNEESAQKRMK